MKKYLCFLLFGVLCGPAIAQDEEEQAFALLDSIVQYRNFEATFTYSSQPLQGDSTPPLPGKLALQDQQYRLSLSDQEIVCNGSTLWTYLQEANEVQINDYDPEEEVTTPWNVFMHYRQGYKLLSAHTRQVGDRCYDVLVLQAQDQAYAFSRITLTIDRATQHISRLEALDSQQTLYCFSIITFDTEVAFEKGFFTFHPEDYTDLEVIDLR